MCSGDSRILVHSAENENPSTQEGETEKETEKKDAEYEILREDYPNYDLSFKIIVIGNSGKK